jgi:hypothetical protein
VVNRFQTNETKRQLKIEIGQTEMVAYSEAPIASEPYSIRLVRPTPHADNCQCQTIPRLTVRPQSLGEEIVNSVSHGATLIAVIPGAPGPVASGPLRPH